MKRTYMIPTTVIVNIKLQKMIAESLGKNGNYNGEDYIESRRGRNWDDEWDDDE